MKRGLMIGFAVFFGLLLVLIVLLPVLLDANRFRNRYVPMLESLLHRPVDVQQARFTIFPRLGIRFQHITIADDPAFSTTPFMTIPSADVAVRFMPLLSGRIQIEGVVIQDPIVRVIRNPEGQLNTATLGPSRSSPSSSSPDPFAPRPGESLPAALGMFAVERLSVREGTLHVEDHAQTSARFYQIQDVSLVTESVQIGHTASFHMKGLLQPFGQSVQIDGRFGPLQPALDIPHINIEARSGDVVASAKGTMRSGIVELDVSVPQISTGNIPLHLPLDRPVTIKNLHANMTTRLIPEGHGKNAGRVKIGPLAFDLHSGESILHVSGQSTPLGLRLVGRSSSIQSQDVPLNLPVEQAFALENIEIEALLQQARVDVVAFRANAFKGTIEAVGKWEGMRPAPLLAAEGKFVDFAVEPISQMAGVTTGGVTGTGNFHWDLTGSLSSSGPPALTGTARLQIYNGQVRGYNMLEALETVLQLSKTSGPARLTAFSLFDAKGEFIGSDLRIHSLSVKTTDLAGKASGMVGFDQSLRLEGHLTASPSLGERIIQQYPLAKGMQQNGRVSLPFFVNGTLHKPSLHVNTKALAAQLKQDVQRRVERVLQGDEQELNQLWRDGKDLLKRLFGR